MQSLPTISNIQTFRQSQITRIISNLYTVTNSDKTYDCRARGKFRNDKLTPTVGDIVEFDEVNKYILEILHTEYRTYSKGRQKREEMERLKQQDYQKYLQQF